MSDTARVESTDAIKDFRVHLTKFQEMAGRALGDADSDINKTVRWLEGEGLNFWTSTIRKRRRRFGSSVCTRMPAVRLPRRWRNKRRCSWRRKDWKKRRTSWRT